MSKTIKMSVGCAPPAKDGAKSIRSPEHSSAALVAELRSEMKRVMTDREVLQSVPVRIDMRFYRHRCRADALNLINGVADIIQARCHLPGHRCPIAVIDDDRNIREFHYTEELAETDRYTIEVTPLESQL